MIQLKGYAPDLPSFTPGVITNCAGIVPTLKGMKAAPRAVDTALPALSEAIKGATVVRKLDSSSRFIVGTSVALLEASTDSWIDRTRESAPYTLGSDTRWRFAIQGDTTIAASKTEILQSSTSAEFANVAADAPKAGAVDVVNGFIILIDVNDQGAIFDSADRPHGWWAARSLSTWTPSIANEAFTGSLTSTPGKNRAIKRFGQSAVIFKDRSMYLLNYVGQSGWEATLIPGEAGAVSQEAVIDIGTPENPVLLFMGQEDFYRYDGSRPVSIGSPLSRTVSGEVNKSYTHVSMALHDRVEKNVYFFYPVGSSGNPDKCVVYNYITNQWGRDDRTVEAVVEFIQAGVIYDDLGDSYLTYNDFPDSSYDTAFWSAGYPTPSVVDASHKVQTLNGEPLASSMILGDYGSDASMTFLSRVQPLFTIKPDSATMRNYYRANLGDDLVLDQTVAMDAKGRFDVLRSANWHRPQLEFAGDAEFGAVMLELKTDGLE